MSASMAVAQRSVPRTTVRPARRRSARIHRRSQLIEKMSLGFNYTLGLGTLLDANEFLPQRCVAEFNVQSSLETNKSLPLRLIWCNLKLGG
jgi:hypothetical protein